MSNLRIMHTILNLKTFLFAVGIALLIPLTHVSAAVNDCPFHASDGDILVHFPDAGLSAPFRTQPNRLLSYTWAGRPYKVDTAKSIPAGKYKVSLYAYDSYSFRNIKYQPREQFHVDFMNGNSVVARSAATPDLRDYVKTASWGGVVNGELEISSDVNKVRAVQSAYPDRSSANSVNARCALLEPLSCPSEPYIAEVLEWSRCSGGLQIAIDVRYETPTDCREHPDVPTLRGCTTQCSDGVDNDGDGYVDFPNDPGCVEEDDDDESDDNTTECNDGVDNDGDGYVDYPNDPECDDKDDDDEDNGGSGNGGGGGGGDTDGGSGDSNPPTVELMVAQDGGTGSFGTPTGADIEIANGEQVKLYWNSTHTNSCSSTNFNIGGDLSGDTETVTEPSAGGATTYGVLCSGPGGGPVSDSLTVSKPLSSPTITANDQSVHIDENVEVTWNTNSNDPADCTLVETSSSGLSAAYATALPTNSGVESLKISETTTYTISCQGVGDASVTVYALPKVYES